MVLRGARFCRRRVEGVWEQQVRPLGLVGGKMTGGVKNVNSKSELDDAVKRGISVLHFWASWCEPSRAMEPVLAQLAVDAPQAHFFRVRCLFSSVFACVNLASLLSV